MWSVVSVEEAFLVKTWTRNKYHPKTESYTCPIFFWLWIPENVLKYIRNILEIHVISTFELYEHKPLYADPFPTADENNAFEEAFYINRTGDERNLLKSLSLFPQFHYIFQFILSTVKINV